MSAPIVTVDSIAAFAELGTPEEAAFIYSGFGFSPIPAVYQTKKPKISWKGVALHPSSFAQHFSAPCNLQIQMGMAHGELADIDLDSPRARQLAGFFLPETDCVFGRESSPAGHRIFRVGSAIASKTFAAPTCEGSKPLLELRSDGHLTIFPPSVHSCGEQVRFEEGRDGLPTLVESGALAHQVLMLACATLVSLSWPIESSNRQSLALAFADGFLRRLSLAEVQLIIFHAAKAAGDEEAEQRKAAVADTAKKMAKKSKTQGWPTVEKLLGAKGNEVVAILRDWLVDEVTETSQAKPNVVCAADVMSKPVDWFWPGWLPKGALVILDGDPGQGKSTLACDLAARITMGKALPDGVPCEVGNVLLIGCEDGVASTVKPRLIAAGADCHRVHILDKIVTGSVETMPAFPADLPHLKQAIVESQATLVIIDPIMAFLGSNINTYSDHSVRTALGPLAKLAEELNVVLLCIRHFSKQQGQSAIHKGGGSIGITAAARSVLLVCKDPKDPTVRVLAVAKSNLASKPKSLRYRIVGKKSATEECEAWETSAIEWIGTSDLDADELVAESELKPDTALQKAQAFLQVVLEAGPVKATDLMEQGSKAGHSAMTMQRASQKLKLTKKAIFNGLTKESYWSLDAKDLLSLQLPPAPEPATA